MVEIAFFEREANEQQQQKKMLNAMEASTNLTKSLANYLRYFVSIFQAVLFHMHH